MEKILIRLYVPVIDETFDLFVPLDLKIRDLAAVIAKGVSDLSSGSYVVSGFELMSCRNPDRLLDPNLTLQEYSIPDGAEMMLL